MNWYKKAQAAQQDRDSIEPRPVPELQLSEPEYYDIAEALFGARDSALQKVIDTFKSMKGRGHQPWNVVPLARVKKIWSDFITMGFVRDEKGLDDIANQVLENVAAIRVNTELAGHTPHDPKNMLEDAGIRNLTEKQWAKFYNWMDTQYGAPFSDYALDPIEQDAARILSAKTAEEKIVAIDRLFNRVHRRGDLAALFIEKGSAGLSELYQQGYVRPPEKDRNLYN